MSTSQAPTDANALLTGSGQSFRPRLVEFYGIEGEDFRYFKQTLETFFSILGITASSRKMTILSTQLRRAARTFFSRYLKKFSGESKGAMPSYDDAIEALQDKYITPELVQRFELAFNDMVQGATESPQLFLSRLYEAATLAEIDDDNMIQSRFRAGLLRDIRIFCIQSSAKTFEDWVKHADGWWNAHNPVEVSLVDNPFVPTSNDTLGFTYKSDMGVSISNGTYSGASTAKALKDKSLNGKPNKSVHANKSLPTVDQITDQLKALELRQMDHLVMPEKGNNSEYMNCQHHSSTLNEKELVNTIRKVIKEELRMARRPSYSNNSYGGGNYRNNNGRGYSQNQDYFDNDYANPAEGTYRRYNNNQQQNQKNAASSSKN